MEGHEDGKGASRTYGSSMLRLAALVVAAAALAASLASTLSAAPAAPPALNMADPHHVAVQKVCTACHDAGMFSQRPRPWSGWDQVFARMVRHGAKGSEEELGDVISYFLDNLTMVNVNTSPADELAAVLGVSDPVSAAIVAHRNTHKFADIAELEHFPGIDRAVIEQRKARIQF